MAVRGIHLERDEREDGDRRGQQSEGDGQPGAESVDQTRSERSSEGKGDRQGKQSEAGADRAESVHALEVERNEEQHSEEREEVQQDDDGAHRHRAHAKDGKGHQRVAHPVLNDQKDSKEGKTRRDEAERARRSPAPVLGIDQAVDDGQQSRGEGEDPWYVEALTH